ncbi:MAG: ribosomal protein S19 family protein [Nanoarchaeota archaeon]
MSEEKIFKFKGKTLDELKSLSLEDFSLLVPSRTRRKLLRGFSEQEKKLLAKIDAGEKNIKTHCRDMVVLPSMVDVKIGVYTGKEFLSIKIAPETLGMRFGELAMTRKIAKHTTMGSKKTVVRK